ncbi:MAG: hypothetical protein CSB34_06540 [Desulfobulbus propionicus]|nr:MAG: hypothetical protein CSB34_06540 [Desulfobulbus propionicus]
MSIAENLVTCGKQHCTDNTLADIRIGLGYTCVELQDGAAGVAWTPERTPTSSCTHVRRAGNLHETTEQQALELLQGESHLERAVGLATFNAVNSRVARQTNADEAIGKLGIQATDHVVMVGHFAPLIPRIEKSGCRLDVVDLNPHKLPTVALKSGPELLAECDVAIITATSIINNTVDEVIATLRKSRAAVMLGPSTPLCPEAFQNTLITQLSGSQVVQSAKVKQVISQGGGTMLMKKYLQFLNVTV